MESTKPTPGESLQIINEMILVAKNEFSDNGAFYLLWGWTVFAAAALHYILLQTGYQYGYIVWPILMPAAGIASAVIGYIRQQKNGKRARTWFDRVMFYIWTAFGGALFVTFFMVDHVGWENTYPIIILLYGVGTYISGGVMKFWPLIAGGIACWIIGAFAFFVAFEWQLALMAGAILISYIIPGHILAAKYRRHVSRT